MLQNDVITVFVAALAMGGLMTLLVNLMLRMRESRYDLERKRIELDMLRSSFERKIYDANDKLIATPDRWKDVNHLIVEAVRRLQDEARDASSGPQGGRSSSRFLKSMGVSEADFKVVPNTAFVLTPFHERFEETYNTIVRICSRVGVTCSRGDEEQIEGGILSHITRAIISAEVVIANIDGRNPNVFYELGIAHTLDKEVILVASARREIPFDFRNQQIIIYRSVADLEDRLLTRLAQTRRG